MSADFGWCRGGGAAGRSAAAASERAGVRDVRPADPDGEHGRTVDPVSGGVGMDVAMYPASTRRWRWGSAAPRC